MQDDLVGALREYAALAGRQLFSIIFILSSAAHFKTPTLDYAAQHGVPLPGLLVPLSGIVALVGGLSVLFGYQTRLGAWLLAIFLVPVTLVMHNFWAAPDARAFQIERALFLRNAAMLGGALLMGYFGGGPLSLDTLIRRDKRVSDPTQARYVVPAADTPQRASRNTDVVASAAHDVLDLLNRPSSTTLEANLPHKQRDSDRPRDADRASVPH